MIGKIIVGKSFRGCLMYCLHDKQKTHENEVIFKNRAEMIAFNQCNGTALELVKQFNRVRALNTNLSKPVFHITLSMAPGEQLSKDKLMEVAEQCAKDFGFENNQYISILHKDTAQQHMHIVANRIGFDRKTVRDSNSYKKVATFCRKMELTYKLQQVQSPCQFLSDKDQIKPSQDKRKIRMQQDVRGALLRSANFQDFELLMKEKNYRVIKGRGIAFIDDKRVYVKGSEIGFSLQTAERILAQQSQKTSLHQPASLSMQHSLNQTLKNTLTNRQKLLENLGTTNNLSNIINKTLEELMRPKEMGDYIPHQLQPKQKKKQHRPKL